MMASERKKEMNRMQEYLLSTKGLTKQYVNHKAADNVDIHIKKGAIYGFIGRNGAGKTTCLKMISGLATPTSGEIKLFGYSGNELRDMTILISSHILEELSKIATDYGIIHNGTLLQEITREELMKRCSERMEIKLPNPENALPVLDKMGFVNYQVMDKELIYIYERLQESAAVNMELVKAGVPVQSISITNEELENYFLNLTGGARNV